MIRVWAVIVHTMKDGLGRRVWYPFLAAVVLSVLLLIFGFGIYLTPNRYADNILSSFFMFWTWGTLITSLCLGAISIPVERQSQTLFTLPIARWEMLLGKLLGTQILIVCTQVAGYSICLLLAAHTDL